MRKLRLLFTLSLLMTFNMCRGENGSVGWEYRHEIKSKGTRSEHIMGHLLFAERELPAELEHVVTPIGEYGFIKPTYTKSDQQWFPCYMDEAKKLHYLRPPQKDSRQRGTAFVKPAEVPLSKEKLEIGWYKGSLDEPLKGTPSHWLFVTKHQVWLDPLRSSAFLKSLTK